MPERYARHEGAPEPSPHLLAHLPELEAAAALGPVLDLACGRGRHALALAERGLPVVGLDRNADFLAALRSRAARAGVTVACVRTDLETRYGIPVRSGSCGAVLVYRFLFRPLAPEIERVLAPGGLLLYETFTLAQREVAHGPSNPDFLLAPGELPKLFPGLEVLSYAELWDDGPRPDAVARLCARRAPA